MRDYKDIIKQICDVIKVIDIQRFTVFEKVHVVAHRDAYDKWRGAMITFGSNTALSDNGESMIEAIALEIYRCFYSTGTLVPDVELLYKVSSQFPYRESQLHYMSHLSTHNSSLEMDDLYWQVTDISHGEYYVSKNNQVRLLKSGEYVHAHEDTILDIGTYVHIKKWKEDQNLQSAFYYVYSEGLMPEDVDIIRFYINMDPLYSHVLINELTTTFNKYQVPFTFKCLNHPDLYATRVDNSIVYLDKYNHHISWQILEQVLERVKPFVQQSSPIFSFQIMEGVGFAEDPGPTQSFGMSRCKIVAKMIWNAYSNGSDIDNSIIMESFAVQGLDIEKVFLNSDSEMGYKFISY